MKKFDGTYYKHQKGGYTTALIAGATPEHAFIQVITNKRSFYFEYPLTVFQPGETVKIDGNIFSANGIKLNIERDGVSIYGEIEYSGLTPLRYDIMGPFKFLPLQCRHKIISLHHRLRGSLTVCGEAVDFTGGTGYIEGDSGTSFPKSYAWIQCGDFSEKMCITASVADIPFLGLHFHGCICVVYYKGAEYRLATYLGAKILCCNEKRIILKQGRLRLEIDIGAGEGYQLLAPEKGKMTREIRERIVCGARFRLLINGKTLLDKSSENASFEYVD